MGSKHIYRTVILLVAVYLVIVAATVFRWRSEQFPVPTASTLMSGEWAEEVENYLEHNIGFHDTLFRMKTSTELFIGERMVQGVYITDDRLLEKVPDLSPPDEKTAQVLEDFYSTYKIPTYLIIVPSAMEIYENRLPRNALHGDQENAIRKLYASAGTNIRCIDACNALTAASDGYIYYRTDSRWTSYGAYCVYQAAMRKMGFMAITYKNYVISHLSTEFRGNLYERTLYDGVKADVLDMYSYEGSISIESVTARYSDGTEEDRGTQLSDPAYLDSEDMYRFYLGTPCETLIVRTNLENDKRLLLYKDELADCFIPFLLQHYSEICVVNLEQTGLNFANAADPASYTQVLFLAGMDSWCELMES